jgi:hypothetical protein
MKRRADYGGRYLRIARNRQTGTVTTVIDNRDRWYSDDPEDWINECHDHATLLSHETRKLAEEFAAHPEEWCEFCQMIDEFRRDPLRDHLSRDPRERLVAMLAITRDPYELDLDRTVERARREVAEMTDEEVNGKVGASVLTLDRN